MAYSVSYIYEILDRYSGPIQRITAQTRRFKQVAASAGKGAKALSARMDNVARRANILHGAIGTAGITAALKNFIGASSLTEDAMSDIGRVSNATASELAAFEMKLEEMSEYLGKTKVGLAQMAYEGGKLGRALSDMESFLMATARVAIAFDVQDQEAGRIVGSIQSKMGLAQREIEALLDSVNYVADNTAANSSNMIQVVERLSGTFSTLEFPAEIAAAVAGFADQIQVAPELAASGFQMMINRMRRVPGMTEKLMADPLKAITGELEKLRDMSPELRTIFARKLYGERAMLFVEKAVPQLELFRKTVGLAMSAEATGSMQRELENRLRRSSTIFAIVGAAFANTADTIGDAIKPLAVDLAKGAVKVMQFIREFAAANPVFVKHAAIVLAVVASLSAMAVVVGVLMAALAPIVALLGGFGGAIGILAAVGAAAAALVMWSEPIKDFFSAWSESIKDFFLVIFESVAKFGTMMMGVFDGAWNAISSFVDQCLMLLDKIDDTLDGVMSKIASVWNKAAGGVTDIWDAVTGVFGSAPASPAVLSFPMPPPVNYGNDTASQALLRQQDINVGGRIEVSASKGAVIDDAHIDLDGGLNLAVP